MQDVARHREGGAVLASSRSAAGVKIRRHACVFEGSKRVGEQRESRNGDEVTRSGARLYWRCRVSLEKTLDLEG